MFKKIFIKLCNKNNVSPNYVCSKVGLSGSAFTQWNNESVPRTATLMRIADYFKVSVEYLKGEETTTESIETTNSMELSSQEQALINIFRSTTEEGRLEMIASFMKIKNDIEKKHLDKNQDTSESNIG